MPRRSGSQIRLPAKKSRCTKHAAPGVERRQHRLERRRRSPGAPSGGRRRRTWRATTSRTASPSAVSAIVVGVPAGQIRWRRGARCIADQHIDGGVEQRPAPMPRGSSSAREAVVAEILLQQQPSASSAAKISGTDSAERRQMGADAQERPDVLGRRRIHQHRRARAAGQAQIAAEAGVLGQRFGVRRADSRARARNAAIAVVAAHAMRPIRSGQPDSTARRLPAPVMRSATVRASAGRSAPSRSGHSTSTMPSRASSQPSSARSAGPVQPPQIEMMHRADARLVALHQGEGRARHLQRRYRRDAARRKARANAVLPAPSSPSSRIASPARASAATAAASASVAARSGSSIEACRAAGATWAAICRSATESRTTRRRSG